MPSGGTVTKINVATGAASGINGQLYDIETVPYLVNRAELHRKVPRSPFLVPDEPIQELNLGPRHPLMASA